MASAPAVASGSTPDRTWPAAPRPSHSGGQLGRVAIVGAGITEVSGVLSPRGLDIGRPTGPDWADCAFLSSREGVERSLARVRAAHGATAEVAASYLANWYAAGVVGPAIASYVLLRRVPALDAAQMSMHWLESGWFDRTALHRHDVTVLPGDSLAGTLTVGRPGGGLAAATGAQPWGAVRVVPDGDALREALVEAILDHLGPFVGELRARVRLGLPALWGAVAGQCARAFLLTERATGEPATGRDEADAFFERASPTLRARPRWHEFVHRGRPYVGMRCGSCCLAHRLGDEHCTTCPFTDDTEREQRMRAWIDTQGHGGLAV
ncbi:(2Fe-2S)-binding protein [Frankia sp. AgKG'84/4]|uniref:(2Fe-2S)-binding protein n=1 Tax=Frankia sp. AgKG'84/4 TaxID=573490 RepID=UPI00200CB4EA|nr:(2Fe-2S)-binding protein [Frankia sp. AgKG'84/4]MCL9795090.1 (2Fe-2S)-binding protein [Frankia sp. AgKG'84/4]